MQFFSSAIDTLQTLVVALGAGLGVWGVVNLLEGYGSDNPGSNTDMEYLRSTSDTLHRSEKHFHSCRSFFGGVLSLSLY